MGHNDLAMAPVRIVIHPSRNQAQDTFTSGINHEMLTPSYQNCLPYQATFLLLIYHNDFICQFKNWALNVMWVIQDWNV